MHITNSGACSDLHLEKSPEREFMRGHACTICKEDCYMVANQKENTLNKGGLLGALMLVGSMPLAFAETEIYGQIRLSLESSNATSPVNWQFDKNGNIVNKGPKVTGMKDQGSRLGLIGSEELESFTLLYHLEWGFNAANSDGVDGGFSQRLAYMTLKNRYGALTVGKIENPFKQMLQVRTVTSLSNSNWNAASMSAAGDLFQGSMGSIVNFNSTMMFRVGSALLYTSPSWSGFNFDAAVVMSQKSDQPDYIFNKRRNIDLFTANLNYFHNSGVYVKAGYISGNTEKPGAKAAYVWGLSLGYTTPRWGVNLYGSIGETKGLATFGVGNERSRNYWNNIRGLNLTPSGYKHRAYGIDLNAYYVLDESLMTKVYGSLSHGHATKKERNGLFHQNREEKNRLGIWAVGVEHKLSSRTKVWAEYESMTVKQSFSDETNRYYHKESLSNNKFLIGFRHDF